MLNFRSCGGEVSWQDGYGKNLGDTDDRITHVIIDRPTVANRHIARSGFSTRVKYKPPARVNKSFMLGSGFAKRQSV